MLARSRNGTRALTFALHRRFAGCLSVPVVVLGNQVYWPGYVARDRCKLGVYTGFQFAGLVYWGVVLLFPTAALGAILYVLIWFLLLLVWFSVIPLGGMGVWLVPAEILSMLVHSILVVLCALVILWVLVPLNWLTCLIGAILGAIASCSEPHREGEGPPVVVLGTIASDVDAAAAVGTKEVVFNPVLGED